MESRAPVSREVVHRAGAPPCAVDDGNASACGDLHDRSCRTNEEGLAYRLCDPSHRELKVDGLARPSLEISDVVPNTQGS
jgi:hypothetical protein